MAFLKVVNVLECSYKLKSRRSRPVVIDFEFGFGCFWIRPLLVI